MDKEKLINKVFESGYLYEYSRNKSFFFRHHNYPEILVDVGNYGIGEIYISLCIFPDSDISLEDMIAIDYYRSCFESMFGEATHFSFYIIQNYDKIEISCPVIGEFPDFEFVFFGDFIEKYFFNGNEFEDRYER
ncbi:hypothetical protein [Sphingobacterium cellulitidis]|uniref:hypothetical protein n=1 Tax=Sphingobacterium cellulitidis TaxID=1768011 RepID=UPI000B943365|nr:hypothetical protein CHT99_15695 [Sphingobacterium cellulitidis]